MGTRMNPADLELYKKIDKIIYYDWNPIGVINLPRDEYQSYIPRIFSLKKAGASVKEIAEVLFKLESETMGMKSKIENCVPIAE